MNSNYSPGIISMLPLFYVGWRDSILSPSEMKMIHQRVESMPHLTPEDKAYLIKHTNPAKPPAPKIYKDWLQAIKSGASDISSDMKSNLSQLGAEMAHINMPNASDDDIKLLISSLREIEIALGIDDSDIQNRLFRQIGVNMKSQESTETNLDPIQLYSLTNHFKLESKAKVRQLLLDPLFNIDEDFADKNDIRDITLQRLKALADQGMGSLSYPKENEGDGDVGAYMAAFETLAYHDLSLSVKFGVQFGLFGGAILNLGTRYHHDQYLQKTGTGAFLGCFAMTETGHGSNVKDLETTLIYEHETASIIVHSPTKTSGKEYIGNALHAHFAVVFGQLIVGGVSHGIHSIIVPMRDTLGVLFRGVKVMDCGYKIGLNGVDNGRIWFDKIRVPVRNLLNRFGDIDAQGQYVSPIESDNKRFFTMLGTLVGGRICVGLGALSASKTALTIALRYALSRRQFAPGDGMAESLIMDYPTHQHRLVPLLIKTFVIHNALSVLAAEFVADPDEKAIRKIETKAAGLKALATWHSSDTIQTCREACGGKGYLSENGLGRLKADSDIFTTFEGDNTVLMQLVAKGLLTEFNQSFHEEGFKAVLRYLGGKIQFRLSEYNPLFTRNTSIQHISSDEFQSDALKYREKKTLIALADRMKSYLDKRMEPNEAFLKCQIHMIDAGRAYIERTAYRMMQRQYDKLKPSPEKEVLMRIKQAYALTIIMENRNWYLENDYVEGSKTKALRRVYDKAIKSFRYELPVLIDALGVNERQFYIKP
ncbi:MAG: acyl-CoA dehydrogenase family protein [Saprospiraceae bacterium]